VNARAGKIPAALFPRLSPGLTTVRFSDYDSKEDYPALTISALSDILCVTHTLRV
jgi:hypothetical protein